MTIRPATIEDVAAIHQLGTSVDEFKVNDETVNFWPKALLSQAVQSDGVLILVAEDDDIAGFLIVNYNSSLKKALIENIYVQPEKRAQGVSDELLEAMFNHLLEMDCEYIATLVPPDAHSAIDLYKRNGFSEGETFMWLDKVLDDTFKRVERSE